MGTPEGQAETPDPIHHAMTSINPLRLAEKIHRIRRGECLLGSLATGPAPRLEESLWFIQWAGMQPGGIEKLADSFLADSRERVGIEAMRAAGSGPWNLEQCLSVWKEARRYCEDLRFRDLREFTEWSADKPLPSEDEDWQAYGRQKNFDAMSSAELKEGLRRFNRDYFVKGLSAVAAARLPQLLQDLCERPECSTLSPSYFADFFPAFLDYMDRHAAKVRATLAQTAVADLVFKRLAFTRSSKLPALILGDSRLGKTRSVGTWATMHPGRARVVTAPCDEGMPAFYFAHAKALGMDYSHSTPIRKLKLEIEYIIEHSDLVFLYDEAHYIIPQNYTSMTPPARMNWVRGYLIDRGVGVAFFSTRQSYHNSMAKFAKKTHYQFDQWIGRITAPLILPTGIERTEVQAVACRMFPEVDADILTIVVERCIERKTGLQEIEGVVKYALELAGLAGRTAPEPEDLALAFVEYLGESAPSSAPPALLVREDYAAPARPDREASAGPAPAPAPAPKKFSRPSALSVPGPRQGLVEA